MFIYARSEQCDLEPIYAITNTEFIQVNYQNCYLLFIRIYPGELKSILVKISPDPGR